MSHNPIRPWRSIERRKSRQIRVGNVLVGGDAPIAVQTMTNTPTEDAAATIAQIGCCKSDWRFFLRPSISSERSFLKGVTGKAMTPENLFRSSNGSIAH